MSTEIVKVQLPLSGPGPALIYDRERKHVETRFLHKDEIDLMRNDMKIYAKAKWFGRTWAISDRANWQLW